MAVQLLHAIPSSPPSLVRPSFVLRISTFPFLYSCLAAPAIPRPLRPFEQPPAGHQKIQTATAGSRKAASLESSGRGAQAEEGPEAENVPTRSATFEGHGTQAAAGGPVLPKPRRGVRRLGGGGVAGIESQGHGGSAAEEGAGREPEGRGLPGSKVQSEAGSEGSTHGGVDAVTPCSEKWLSQVAVGFAVEEIGTSNFEGIDLELASAIQPTYKQ